MRPSAREWQANAEMFRAVAEGARRERRDVRGNRVAVYPEGYDAALDQYNRLHRRDVEELCGMDLVILAAMAVAPLALAAVGGWWLRGRLGR